MKKELRTALINALKELHTDALAVMNGSRLDAVSRIRLSKMAEDILKISNDLQSVPQTDQGCFARLLLVYAAFKDNLLTWSQNGT